MNEDQLNKKVEEKFWDAVKKEIINSSSRKRRAMFDGSFFYYKDTRYVNTVLHITVGLN